MIRELGIIKIIDDDDNFPWHIFADGEINCAYQLNHDSPINDMRIWINQHLTETVYLKYNKWSRSSGIAFVNPEDAVKFAVKFGDVLKQIND